MDPYQSREAIRCAGSFPRGGGGEVGERRSGEEEKKEKKKRQNQEEVILVRLSEIDAVD